jgi:hypothetical protein
MIVVRLYGGLGNQLFQYAMGRSLSLSRGTPLVLDLDWYHRSSGASTPRHFELHRYPIVARVAATLERLSYRARTSRIASRHPWLRAGWTFHREAGVEHDPRVMQLAGNVHLDGYWQSPMYFEGIADRLRAELTPMAEPGPHDLQIAGRIGTCNAVSVHVRRGDYVNSLSTATHHGTCGPDYYQRAIEILVSTLLAPHFFVFSDDVEWSRATLAFPGPVTFVDHNGPDTAFQDLRLMSLCQHHIIANSSFSWWGAWLNTNPAKKVIAPRRWFADGSPTKTLLPADWERL